MAGDRIKRIGRGGSLSVLSKETDMFGHRYSKKVGRSGGKYIM